MVVPSPDPRPVDGAPDAFEHCLFSVGLLQHIHRSDLERADCRRSPAGIDFIGAWNAGI